MRNPFFTVFIITLVSCTTAHKTAKIDYKIVPDNKAKILKGVINRALIENDTAFVWFKENMKWGQTDEAAIGAFKEKADKFKLVVFGGTWCPDTQNLLPIFYRLVDKSGYPDKNITLIAVDRKKETIHNLNKIYNIISVPTFIVIKDGKEIGRVVEYGKMNAIDKELGQIVKTIE